MASLPSAPRAATPPTGRSARRGDPARLSPRRQGGLCRLEQVRYADADTYNFTYDAASRPLRSEHTRDGVAISYVYDSSGRTAAETTTVFGHSFTVKADHFDALNRPDSVQYPSGTKLGSSYTERGQLKTLQFGAQTLLQNRGYDNAGRIHTINYGNGRSTSITYTPNDNLIAQIQIPGIENSISYTYDGLKRITNEVFANQGTNRDYTYDAESRLVATQGVATDTTDTHTWDLSPLGNWNTYQRSGSDGNTISDTRTHSDLNEVTTERGVALHWDYQGNQLNDRHGKQFQWDQSNRLQGIAKPDNSQLATYGYDTAGRRVWMRLGDTLTIFVHSGQQMVAEYAVQMSGNTTIGQPALVRSYVYGVANAPLAQIEASTGAVLYLHTRLDGSPIALSNAQGNRTASYRYDPYGQRHTLEGDSVVLPWGLNGHRLDSHSGLYQMRQRYYDPERGGFISRDFLGFEAGLNWHLYAGGDPVGKWDPMGLVDMEVLPGYWVNVDPVPTPEPYAPLDAQIQIAQAQAAVTGAVAHMAARAVVEPVAITVDAAALTMGYNPQLSLYNSPGGTASQIQQTARKYNEETGGSFLGMTVSGLAAHAGMLMIDQGATGRAYEYDITGSIVGSHELSGWGSTGYVVLGGTQLILTAVGVQQTGKAALSAVDSRVISMLKRDFDYGLVPFDGSPGRYSITDSGQLQNVFNGQFAGSLNRSSNGALTRPSLRAGTIRAIEASAEKDVMGNFLGRSGEVLTDINYGHVYGRENRRVLRAAEEVGLTQDQLNNYINSRPEFFTVESRSDNLSHAWEMPGAEGYEPIMLDMQIYLETQQ